MSAFHRREAKRKRAASVTLQLRLGTARQAEVKAHGEAHIGGFEKGFEYALRDIFEMPQKEHGLTAAKDLDAFRRGDKACRTIHQELSNPRRQPGGRRNADG